MKNIIKKAVNEALNALPSRHAEVLSLHYGLEDGRFRSLQEIGNKYGISRERARQIRNSALEKLLQDECVDKLSDSIVQLENAVDDCGGFATEEKICKTCGIVDENDSGYVRLLLDLGSNFYLNKGDDDLNLFWTTRPEKKNEFISTIKHFHKLVKKDKRDIFTKEELYSLLNESLKKNAPKLVKNNAGLLIEVSKKISSNKYDDWGEASNPEISLSNIRGCIRLILRREDKPLHFSDISRKVKEIKEVDVKESSCHNELVLSDDFELVGKGLYKLKGV